MEGKQHRRSATVMLSCCGAGIKAEQAAETQRGRLYPSSGECHDVVGGIVWFRATRRTTGSPSNTRTKALPVRWKDAVPMLGGGAGVIGIECCIGVGRVSKQSRGIQVSVPEVT